MRSQASGPWRVICTGRWQQFHSGIVGVPQFAPVVASPATTSHRSICRSLQGVGITVPADHSAKDLFAPWTATLRA